MSSTQAVAVHQNLLQLLSGQMAAFQGLQSAGEGGGGLFGEALLNSLNAQAAALSTAPSGSTLPAGGEALPPGLEELLSRLQQELDAAGIDLQSLSQGDDVEASAELLRIVQELSEGDPGAAPVLPEELVAQLRQRQSRVEQPAPQSSEAGGGADVAETVLNHGQSPSAGQQQTAGVPQEKRPESPDVAEQQRASTEPAVNAKGLQQSGTAQEGAGPGAAAPRAEGRSEPRPATAPASEQAAEGIEQAVASITKPKGAAAGESDTDAEPRQPRPADSADSEARAAAAAAMAAPLREASAEDGDAISRSELPSASPSRLNSGAADGAVKSLATERAQATVVATSNQQPGAGGEGSGESSRQFRDNLASIQAELNGIGKNGGEPERSDKGGFTNVFSAATAASASGNQAGLSNFQQLQAFYNGDGAARVGLSLPERFGSEQWTPGLSQRVMWMSNQQVGRAELRLDPPDLGSLNIRLSIQNDQASLSFSSPHAHVRDMLEQQMPRLREMLAENGIELNQTDISDRSESGQSDHEQEDRRSSGAGSWEGPEVDDGLATTQHSASLSLVDYYA